MKRNVAKIFYQNSIIKAFLGEKDPIRGQILGNKPVEQNMLQKNQHVLRRARLNVAMNFYQYFIPNGMNILQLKQSVFTGKPYLFYLITLAFLTNSCQTDTILDPHPCDFPELEAYSLVWSDEFEGSELNPEVWTHEIGDGCDRGICGWGNNELQYYTDAKKNAQVKDGNLIIRAFRETTPIQGYNYSSARLVTKNKADFRFGRMDIRAKLPKGQGIWPAIWMLPTENAYGEWPKSGEIDIMELIGSKPSEVLGTVHYGHDFWRYKSSEYQLESGDFSQDFHTFTLLWRENCLRFMVDGQLFGDPITPSVTLPTGYPFNETFHFILNIAVGGNLPGNPDGTTVFPQTMEVDYVRVYQEN